MLNFYRFIEKIWFNKIPQKIRFLLVGGFNTIIAYLIFLGLYYLLNNNYTLSIVLQYIISINISILTMRYYVFQSKGDFGKEYTKACGVYACMLCFNYVWLYVFIDTLGINAPISQALYLTISTILTYIFHKYFSFKKTAI